MKINVTKKKFLDLLKDAVQSRKSFEEFCEFIFNYFYAEDDYDFEDDILKTFFELFVDYFVFEESYKDPDIPTRFKRIIETLENGNWDLESVIFASNLEKINNLNKKLNKKLITQEIFKRKIKELTPIKFNYKKFFKLIEKQFSNQINNE